MNQFILVLIFTFLAHTSIAPTKEESKLQELEKWNEKLKEANLELLNLKERLIRLDQLSESRNTRYFDVTNVCEGRLTLETGVPISTSDQTSSNIYFTPYKGNGCSVYTGTVWQLYSFSEITYAVSGLTIDTNYDLFIYNNSGTLALEAGPAWSSNTARAAGGAITLVDGIYVRSSDNTRRYIGTFRTTATNQTQDTSSKRYLWSYVNQVPKFLKATDGTNTWTYNTNSWRVANNATTTNLVEYVVGLAEVFVQAHTVAVITNSTGKLEYYASGVGIDSTTVNSSLMRGSGSDDQAVNQANSEYKGYPGLGYHAIYWLERSSATAITVWGDNGDATRYQSGMLVEIQG